MPAGEDLMEPFRREGYALVPGALSAPEIETLLAPLRDDHKSRAAAGERFFHRFLMHEKGQAFLELIDHPSVIDFVEALLGKKCHVISYIALVTTAASENHLDSWHVDDWPFVPRGEDVPWDDRIVHPTFVCSALFYLTDVRRDMGPTELVPRSHRSGRAPEPRAVEPSYDGNKPVPILAKAGDCLLYDSQIWHRGSPHRGGADRYAVKVVYGRRFMAQRFYPNVGRQVPERILDGLSPRRKRLLGFHETMEYGPE